MHNTSKHLQCIRAWLNKNELDAFIIPHDDEYLSEYVPPENERLRWATGFTGSAGYAIVCIEKTAIFVDGRYTVQVQQQVNKNDFEILHLLTDPYLIWIKDNTSKGAKIGFDPKLHSYQWFKSAKQMIGNSYSLIPIENNPIDISWKDRELRKFSTAFS